MKIYLVCQYHNKYSYSSWSITALFDSKKEAEKYCDNDHSFYMEMELNKKYSKEVIVEGVWKGRKLITNEGIIVHYSKKFDMDTLRKNT